MRDNVPKPFILQYNAVHVIITFIPVVYDVIPLVSVVHSLRSRSVLTVFGFRELAAPKGPVVVYMKMSKKKGHINN